VLRKTITDELAFSLSGKNAHFGTPVNGAAADRTDLGLELRLRLAEALEYGLVGVNDATGYTHEIPFGGFKESGLGREGGHEGLEEYLESKSIVLNMPQS
jgi:succinate-semialdehyde dehydrogenase/glutarate-semialdehyde dehydrogenase